ncbi:MAG: HAMP domain-containing protein [Leptolyngbyaceae cyanobacterium SM1_4_3]|nr:HAMP domain-containing protein [Leptolyngbyaceae cyanobacterium SM1_4_3]
MKRLLIQNWLHNLQIQPKIAWGYVLPLGIAIAGTGLGITLAEQQQKYAEALGEDALEELDLLTRLRLGALGTLLEQEQVTSESLSQPAYSATQYEKWLENYVHFRQTWQEFKQTENNTLGQEEIESEAELEAVAMFLQKYSEALNEYFQAFDQLVAGADSATFTPEVGVQFEEISAQLEQSLFVQLSDDLNEDLTTIEVLIRDEYTDAQTAIDHSSVLRLQIISLSVVASTVIASVLSILTSRAIARPILMLTRMAQQMTQGDLSVRVLVKSQDEIGELGKTFNQMAEQLAERNLLTQEIHQLQQMLGELEKNQAKLIHTEKMSSLGQLVTGIAHEINTPLGAIQSSVGNITHALQQALEKLPLLLQTLPPERLSELLLLLEWSQQTQETLSSREERQLKRQIKQSLEDQGIAQADKLSSTLSKMGIAVALDPILPLLQIEDAPAMLQTVYQLAVVQNNSQNIRLAVERASRIVYALRSFARQDVLGVPSYASISEGIETVLTLYRNQIKAGVEIEKSMLSCRRCSAIRRS